MHAAFGSDVSLFVKVFTREPAPRERSNASQQAAGGAVNLKTRSGCRSVLGLRGERRHLLSSKVNYADHWGLGWLRCLCGNTFGPLHECFVLVFVYLTFLFMDPSTYL